MFLVHRIALALAVGAAALSPVLVAAPASAETLYLKNGTQVSGTITKEDAETFVVETRAGRRKIAKQEMEVVSVSDPTIAGLTGLLLSGAGHAYLGAYDRAALYFGLSAAGGAAGYFAAQQIRPTSPSTAAVTAIVVYALPMLVGAFDAHQYAAEQTGKARYKIDYTKSAE